MKNKFFKKCLEIAVIVIGNAILAFGICAFITPHGIIVGGASGLGLIVKQITGIPLSIVVYVINIIMFIAGYFFLGKSFAAKTLLSTIIFPTFLTIFENTPGVTHLTNDLLLSSVYAGIFVGGGLGLVLRMGASSGGMDIPPLVLNKKTGISTTVLINGFDCIILALQVPFSNVEQILYGILVVLITALVMDKMIFQNRHPGQSRPVRQEMSSAFRHWNSSVLPSYRRFSSVHKYLHGNGRGSFPLHL